MMLTSRTHEDPTKADARVSTLRYRIGSDDLDSFPRCPRVFCVGEPSQHLGDSDIPLVGSARSDLVHDSL
jgi:hypothetical protein